MTGPWVLVGVCKSGNIKEGPRIVCVCMRVCVCVCVQRPNAHSRFNILLHGCSLLSGAALQLVFMHVEENEAGSQVEHLSRTAERGERFGPPLCSSVFRFCSRADFKNPAGRNKRAGFHQSMSFYS